MSACTVVVCRGCCCGLTSRKRPSPDAGRMLALLRELLAGRAVVETSECLGPCGSKDVVVVRPSSAGRIRGGRPEWFGWTRDEASVRALAAYVLEGGPGCLPVPDELDLQRFNPREGRHPRRATRRIS